MKRPELVLGAIEAIYAAAVDPAAWDEALRELARALDATSAGLHVERGGVAVTQRWVGLDAGFVEPYRERYWKLDPWAAGARTLRRGDVGHGDRLVRRSVLERGEFYVDFSRPFEVDDLLAAAVDRSRTTDAFVSVVGGPRRRFDDDDAHVLRQVVPHLRRALDIGERLRTFPFDEPPSLETWLMMSHGLTRAEARVAACVGRGMVPKEAAQTIGSSWNTVRFQLRQIYAKVHVNGQAELARLITRLELTR